MHRPPRFLAPVLALLISTGAFSAMAQTKSKSSSSKSKASATEEKETTKKKTSKYHRLPPYYGQLELKDEQIEDIYQIKDSYGEKIDALMKELEELKDKQDEEIKDVLTRTQVTALNKLIASRSSDSKSSTSKKSTSKK